MTDREHSTQSPHVAIQLADPPSGRTKLERVYREQRDYVWRTLRRLGVPAWHLEDVTHDVFVAVHGSLHRYDPARPLKPWLFGVAFRVASDFSRKAANKKELLEAPRHEVQSGGPTAEEELERARQRALILRALEALPKAQRAVFILHDIDGEKVPAIAKALDVPLNTAYSRLRLARRAFAERVSHLRAKNGGRP